jgi:hypothetical protein
MEVSDRDKRVLHRAGTLLEGLELIPEEWKKREWN